MITTQSSGRAGDWVASRNSTGRYLRPWVTGVWPNTALQVTARNLFKAVVGRWSTVLTEAQRDRWNAFAKDWIHFNALGAETPLSGYQLFVSMNRRRRSAGATFVNNAPSVHAHPRLTHLRCVPTTGGGFNTWTIHFNTSDPWWSTTGAGVLVSASRRWKPTVNFINENFRLRLRIAAGTASPQFFRDTIGPIINPRIALRAYVTLPDGRFSTTDRFLSFTSP